MNTDKTNETSAGEPLLTMQQKLVLEKTFGGDSNRKMLFTGLLILGLVCLIHPSLFFELLTLSWRTITIIAVAIVVALKCAGALRLRELRQIDEAYRRPCLWMEISIVLTLPVGLCFYLAIEAIGPWPLFYAVPAAAVFDLAILCLYWEATSRFTGRFSRELSERWSSFRKRFFLHSAIWLVLSAVLLILVLTSAQSTASTSEYPSVIGALLVALYSFAYLWLCVAAVGVVSIIFLVVTAVGESRLEKITYDVIQMMGAKE